MAKSLRKRTRALVAIGALSGVGAMGCDDGTGPGDDAGTSDGIVEVAGPASQPYGLVEVDEALAAEFSAAPTSRSGWQRVVGTQLAPRLNRSATDGDETYVVGGRELLARVTDDGLEGAVFDAEGYLRGIAAGHDEVWLMGEMSQLFRYDGSALKRITRRTGAWSYTLHDAKIFGPSHGFIVGEEETGYGIVLSYRDGAFDAHLYEDSFVLEAVDGRSADDVFVVGEAGRVWHWDGARFVRLETPTEAWLNDVLIHGGVAWAVGSFGTVLRIEGEAPPFNLTAYTVPESVELASVWSAGGTLYVAGEGVMYRVDDESGAAFTPVGLEDLALDVAHAGPLATGGSLLISEEGTAYTVEDGAVSALVAGPSGDLRCALSDGTTLYVAGERGVWYHSDDDEGFALASEPGVKGLNAAARIASHVVFVGAGGRAHRYDGSSMVREDTGTDRDLNAACALGDEVLAAGSYGTVLRRNVDGAWAADPVPGPTELYALACGDDVAMAAGEGGVVWFKETGGGWTAAAPATDRRWRAGLIASDGTRWVVGDRGGIYAWTEAVGWRDRSEPVTTTFNLVFEVDGAIYVGGRDGALYRIEGEAVALEVTDTSGHLFAGTAFGDDAVVVGAGGLVMKKSAP